MRFDELRVRDIMEKDVVTVRPEISVREFTRLLSEHMITGAPVVTWSGTLVGVVSATDVVRLAAEESELATVAARQGLDARPWSEESDEGEEVFPSYFLPESHSPSWDWTRLGEQGYDEFTVEDIMTPAYFMMPPTATLKELASFLSRGRIHRAVVTEDARLVGIVTTMDVLRALASRT